MIYPRQAFAVRPVTQNIVVGTASATITLPQAFNASNVRLVNSGTQTVFISFSGVATLNDFPLLPNSTNIVAYFVDAPLSAIAAAVGSTLYATVGEGT